MTQITKEAIEAAAIAMHELDGDHKWADASDRARESARSYAIAALSTLPIAVEGKELDGWQLVPKDDATRQFSDSALPREMIDAGAEALEKASDDLRNYVAGETIDWDHGMEAVAVYRAMTAAAPSSPGKDGGQEVEAPKSLVTVARLAGDEAYKRWRGIDTGLDGMHYIAFHIVRALKLEAQPASTALVEALTDAEPYVELCHSLMTQKETRANVWRVLKRVRSALSSSQSTKGEADA